jgi:AcrR family transcriptional regulator
VVHDSSPTPRQRRRDANLQRILDAALELVAAGGLEALSMARLAEAVDYTPGALYRYFGSKDSLLSQLVTRILEDLRVKLVEAEARLPTPATPLSRVFALVQGYRGFAQSQPQRFGLLALTMADPALLQEDADAEPVIGMMIAALRPLAEALGAAEEAGLVDAGDVTERTICLFALLQGVLLLHKQARYAPRLLDVERLAVRGTRGLLLGWGAKPRTVDAAIARVGELPRRPGGDE